ncbi:MAG: hypothetical protein ACI90V_010552, partial [Bacillariaceae sp.]
IDAKNRIYVLPGIDDLVICQLQDFAFTIEQQ